MTLELTDTVLRAKAARILWPPESRVEFIDAMFGAMNRHFGIGLAAPQVGHSISVFVTNVPGDKPRAFINPVIEWMSDEMGIDFEGCLSFPGRKVRVKRPVSCRVSAEDRKGKPFVITARGLVARCILHEYDHLEGVCIIDKQTAVVGP